jgi:hypothetical protein
LRRVSLLRLVINGLLGLALVVFTMSSVPSHGGFGSDAHPLVTLHAYGPHASHDAGHDDHPANGLCGTACAVSVAPLPERGPELARARGVPPAIMAGIEEHSPDDPLPPPRPAAKT